ncbi:hypothetical protein EVAR_100794_1 [Eumeta japonica]|uniref:Uncharacterized protein n=1 Tax=Eumeta variegata TaxID=151549 RepID=A0A4C1SS07_EUMVA|nr:hypothetical protein EVAR_100794_1 [Eumeta japonica]
MTLFDERPIPFANFADVRDTPTLLQFDTSERSGFALEQRVPLGWGLAVCRRPAIGAADDPESGMGRGHEAGVEGGRAGLGGVLLGWLRLRGWTPCCDSHRQRCATKLVPTLLLLLNTHSTSRAPGARSHISTVVYLTLDYVIAGYVRDREGRRSGRAGAGCAAKALCGGRRRGRPDCPGVPAPVAGAASRTETIGGVVAAPAPAATASAALLTYYTTLLPIIYLLSGIFIDVYTSYAIVLGYGTYVARGLGAALRRGATGSYAIRCRETLLESRVDASADAPCNTSMRAAGAAAALAAVVARRGLLPRRLLLAHTSRLLVFVEVAFSANVLWHRVHSKFLSAECVCMCARRFDRSAKAFHSAHPYGFAGVRAQVTCRSHGRENSFPHTPHTRQLVGQHGMASAGIDTYAFPHSPQRFAATESRLRWVCLCREIRRSSIPFRTRRTCT